MHCTNMSGVADNPTIRANKHQQRELHLWEFRPRNNLLNTCCWLVETAQQAGLPMLHGRAGTPSRKGGHIMVQKRISE